MPSAKNFTLSYYSPTGNLLRVFTDWISLQYTMIENGIGTAVLDIPGAHKESIFAVDAILNIYRQQDSGAHTRLEGNTAWLLRNWEWKDVGASGIWELTFFTLDHILRRRVVDYNAENAYTSKLDYADDMMKEIVHENLGAGATDSTRDLSAYLEINPNTSQGAIIRKAFARRNIMDVLKEIAEASHLNGSYLSFCVEQKSISPLAIEFKTYCLARGRDRRALSAHPLLVGSEYGNLKDAVLSFVTEDEITRGIAGGQGIASARAVARYTGARADASPFNLIEEFVDSRNENDAAGLANDAEAVVKSKRPRTILVGSIVNKPGSLYGLDYYFGDFVTAQARGYSFDCRISAVKNTITREGGESLEIALVGEQ